MVSLPEIDTEGEAFNAAILTVSIYSHPKASVVVTLYVPTPKPEMVLVIVMFASLHI